jgi:transcriptional regulator with XRE-family HTH domain
MRLSTISKRSRVAQHGPLAAAIGNELRRLRESQGLAQAAVGDPLTRAFVSSVERGRVVPSLPALLLMTERLGVDLARFFDGVNRQMTVLYTPAHGRGENPPPRGRR